MSWVIMCIFDLLITLLRSCRVIPGNYQVESLFPPQKPSYRGSNEEGDISGNPIIIIIDETTEDSPTTCHGFAFCSLDDISLDALHVPLTNRVHPGSIVDCKSKS